LGGCFRNWLRRQWIKHIRFLVVPILQVSSLMGAIREFPSLPLLPEALHK
jgi:hypothetical protein